jgi:hypothetical protein
MLTEGSGEDFSHFEPQRTYNKKCQDGIDQ